MKIDRRVAAMRSGLGLVGGGFERDGGEEVGNGREEKMRKQGRTHRRWGGVIWVWSEA